MKAPGFARHVEIEIKRAEKELSRNLREIRKPDISSVDKEGLSICITQSKKRLAHCHESLEKYENSYRWAK